MPFTFYSHSKVTKNDNYEFKLLHETKTHFSNCLHRCNVQYLIIESHLQYIVWTIMSDKDKT